MTTSDPSGRGRWAALLLAVITPIVAELNLPYHAVFSVALPILLADLMFPSLRDRPYLKGTGLVVAGVVFVLGGALLRWSVAGFIDPGYQAPVAVVVGCLAVVALLAAAALRFVPAAPNASAPAAGTSAAPGSWTVGVFGGIVAFGYLALLFPFGGATQPAFTQGGWVAVPMLVAAILAVLAGWLVRRWTTGSGWTDRHSLALAGGALVAHTAFGVVANAETLADRAGLTALGLIMIGLLALLSRRIPA
ncbi:hypothetical protein AB0F17_60355 [Nonomuraea sp. NPDC026600]|uniref:hypothetical protein n=1 Tax=Nonomuraea sp. NPDC026600 TaxID=3155363 RepID=UPI0033D3AFA7